MLLPLSVDLVPCLVQLSSAQSTNAELVRMVSQNDFPAFTTVVTDDQTGGRGRRGRLWIAPRGTALAISVLLKPRQDSGEALDPSRFGWLAIMAGIAMTDAVAELLPAAVVGFKWPNDVQVDGRKICGVLGELLPGGDGVVMGAGINLAMSAQQLPVPGATSATLEGASGENLADRALSTYLRRLMQLVESYGAAGGDADASGVRADALQRCTTIGRGVRAELPGGKELRGEAAGIDPFGRLEIQLESGRVEVIAAGDVVHLR